MYKDLFSASFTLFAVLDIIGCIPLILNLKKTMEQPISPTKATLYSVIIMVFFLYFGSYIFNIFGIAPSHFAVAGSLMILFIGIKMMFGLHFDYEKNNTTELSSNFFPLAFPLIAGPGVLSTLMSLKTDYSNTTIVLGILINSIIIWFGIWACDWIKKKLGDSGIVIIERTFGVILLSIGIKMFIHNLLLVIHLK
jgi:multiple antibiotic resistance protein